MPQVKTGPSPDPSDDSSKLWRTLPSPPETPLPRLADRRPSQIDRREFLLLVEAALASAGLAGCTLQPPERALPYVVAPERLAAGDATYYATTLPFAGYGVGALGKCVNGRPIKVEGLPGHPASLGASSAFMQAEILALYDPDRSKSVVHRGAVYTLSGCLETVRARLAEPRASRGRGLRILAGTVTSEVLANQLKRLLSLFPEARLVRHEPIDDDHSRRGAAQLLGRPLHAVPRLARARRLLLLDSDLLYGDPGAVRHGRDFAEGRSVAPAAMSRMYALEPTPSVTGGNADHRLPVRASRIGHYARAVAKYLSGADAAFDAVPEEHRQWLKAATDDLRAHHGESLVLAGRGQPPEVHALAFWLSLTLGGGGRVLNFAEPFDFMLKGDVQDLAALTADMQDGRVETLVILGANPVYTAPADIPFAAALSKVPFSVHLGHYRDETGESCSWHVPEAHPLESWGDLKAYDGTTSLQQPLIRPLYGGLTAAELIQSMLHAGEPSGLDMLRASLGPKPGPGGKVAPGADADWQKLVASAFVPDSAASGVAATPSESAIRDIIGGTSGAFASSGMSAADEPALELIFRPDPTIWDGRYANNAWLQELPKPYLTLTWDNAVLLSPVDARRLKVGLGEHVRLKIYDREVRGPALPLPGQADGVVSVALGYGRRAGGDLARGRGFDVYSLRRTGELWLARGVRVTRTDRGFTELALVQDHHSMEGREPARAVLAAELAAHPDTVQQELRKDDPAPDQTLYPKMPEGQYAWGMTIDLNRCIGCNACTAACQAENNIPSVGKDEVKRGREMHWIRVDRYFKGDETNPEVRFQPVPCMHCEKAPCEVVCPVEATLHDGDGLNEMIYNRCVGTRYCSNNCPYKVRRFNFFHYAEPRAPVSELVYNPDVSVREHGVMEKCTYCIQRISAARIAADAEGRKIRDKEVVPACAQACPTQAIVFGDLKTSGSLVAKLKQDPRKYDLLAELNTRPRTSYLARVRNPNPAIEPLHDGTPT